MSGRQILAYNSGTGVFFEKVSGLGFGLAGLLKKNRPIKTKTGPPSVAAQFLRCPIFSTINYLV
mgnify:CR=1 FL=1